MWTKAQKQAYDRAYYAAHKAKWDTRAGIYRKRKPTPRNFWSAEDLRVLRRLYPHHATAWVAGQLGRSILSTTGKSTSLRLRKSPAHLRQLGQATARRLQESGKSYRFPKGHVSFNKGRKGLRIPGSEKGWFKKGAKPQFTHPIGSERLVDGYRYVKVAEVPYQPYTVNWLPVHILAWERANGRPLPPKHVLRFIDGDRMNVSLENLELLTMRENMLRNSVHRLPKELVEVVQLRGALMRKINRKTKATRDQST